jgi:hypothetical protein
LIKKTPSKADLRNELDKQMDEFLNKGKNVAEIPRGVSSRDGADKPLRADTWQMDSSKGNWTYLPEVVDSLEKRRQTKAVKPEVKKLKRPKKVLMYDDFGEPLRWVWVDE